MAELRLFTVRPLSKQARSDLKDAFRVHLSASSLAALKLRAGDACNLQPVEGRPKTAIAWSATENIQNTVVQASRTLQDCYGIKIGEKVSISRVDHSLEAINTVFLQDCTDPDKLEKYGQLSDADKTHWTWGLELPLSRCELITAGLVFEMELRGQRRLFKVVNIKPREQNPTATLFQFNEDSNVVIGDDLKETSDVAPSSLRVRPCGLGGMSRQIDIINESLADFNMSTHWPVMPSFYQHSRGILIYGPKGTGKTALLQQIQSIAWRKAFTIGSATFGRNVSDGEARIRSVFQEAVRCQPSAIIIDQLESIAPRRTSLDSQSLVSVLCECLDTTKGALVLVAASSRHPNEVDDALRTPHRLATEIELQVPTAQDRSEILRAIRGDSTQLSDKFVELIAEKTHGYVGADLFALTQLICRKARQQQILEDEITEKFSDISLQPNASRNEDDGRKEASAPLRIHESNILSALQETRPTAMREVFLETPKVRWSDIGGQHDIKKRLQKAVQRPLRVSLPLLIFPQGRLNVNSKKGILLYGPPGCSKTLTVKALATEAGLNFMAVKGAEILSMYVGESERSLREIFRKARSARPSIIFFDEIDAIASKRSSTSQGGVNVLTTLLNEMDGIEELRNVLVIAATNKPEVIDPALMRPGRLDNILYIGLPDIEARREILNIWASKSVINSEVELGELASKTEGYSGAEIINICETAGDAALDEEEDSGEEQEVGWRHFEYALQQVPRQITDEVIQEYESWRNACEI